jgi:pilus assembly protein CpaC
MLNSIEIVFFKRKQRMKYMCLYVCALAVFSAYVADAEANTGLFLPMNRSSLVVIQSPAKEIVIANPDIADVHVNNSKNLTFIGKTAGSTNVRIFDETGKLLQVIDVTVGYDLPAIRRALKTFIPDENIGVEMVNTSVALTGQVRNNAAIDKALKLTQEYIGNTSGYQVMAATSPIGDAADNDKYPKILNMMKLISGQQVMLKVRVSEVNRDALKRLGVDPSVVVNSGNLAVGGALGSAISGLAVGATGINTLPETDQIRGTFGFNWISNSNHRVGAVINALERDGLIKTLAEPNLVAASGEQAEFLAGGEIPVLIPSASGGSTIVTAEYKPFGVSVKFLPDVLSENRIRMMVQPEVSEISTANAVTQNGFIIPSFNTRRAKTTVELAPGESFMIAGLIKDSTKASIDQLPGMKELPILGALFRSTEFQRNESELVITVTPYLVDPMKASEVKTPTDDFRPASQMEMFFYGALGAITTDEHSAKVPQLEGPTGFMVD